MTTSGSWLALGAAGLLAAASLRRGSRNAVAPAHPRTRPPRDPDRYLRDTDYTRALRSVYFDDADRKLASSRTTRATVQAYPQGTWKIDDTYRGLYGHDIEELVLLEPRSVEPGEFEWRDVRRSMLPGRYADAERYAEWLRAGHAPPPIRVVQTDRLTLRAVDGHRRLAAADLAGVKVPAWVSWTMPHPQGTLDSEGRVLRVGMTFEGMHPGARFDR